MKTDTPTTIETWMEEARGLAAQCWCDPETEDRVMDVALCEAVSRRIAAWMDTSAQAYRDCAFYRGIVVEIGEMFGEAAKTSDDGSIQQDVLALKVTGLVKLHLSENGVSSPAVSASPKDDPPSRPLESEGLVNEQTLQNALKLLHVADCPECDGTGVINVRIADCEMVTRAMAIDAGNPEMEGSIYRESQWEQRQCQWCDEREKLLSPSVSSGVSSLEKEEKDL